MATNKARLGASGSVASYWFLYLAFVVYGSLVPLEFTYLPWDIAWAKFRSIQLLDVGLQGRGDWISNGILYIPIGLLTANLLVWQRDGRIGAIFALVAIVFACALAISVEFIQLYFPGRTVSLNDLYAECVGSAVGALSATYWHNRFRSFVNAWQQVALEKLLTYGLETYALLYLGFSFFPLDFVFSTAELEFKVISGAWGWLLAPDFDGNSLLVVIKLAAESLAVAPIGLLLSGLRPKTTGVSGFIFGCALGVAVEIGQFFLYSGITQGMSILTRGIGMAIGALLWINRSSLQLPGLRKHIRRNVWSALLGYVLMLMVVSGWFSQHWTDVDTAKQVFDSTRLLPFYYHYFTTEQAALVSLVAVAMMYAPVGVLTWSIHRFPVFAWFAASLLTLIFETSKLFLQGLHPDPTNVLVGGFSGWMTARMLEFFTHAVRRPKFLEAFDKGGLSPPDHHYLDCGTGEARSLPERGGISHLVAKTVGIAVVLLPALAIAFTFPTLNFVLIAILITNVCLLWFLPYWALLVIPVAVANLDLAPWTGRFFIDEFDLLLASSVLIGYLRTPKAPSGKSKDRLFLFACSVLLVSYIVSTCLGLFPWHPMDANVFSNYYSPLNGLRIAKGVLWAFLYHGLMVRLANMGKPVFGLFSLGMVVSAAGVVMFTLWERLAFPGIFNFTDEYRVTGPFSQMHIGGADLETFLTIVLPFIIFRIVQSSSWLVKVALGILLLAASYCLLVTFARIGYGAYLATGAISVSVVFLSRRGHGKPSIEGRIAATSLLLAVLGVSFLVLSAPFAQSRMSQSDKDFTSRQHHWSDALAIRDSGLIGDIFGTGVGRYPERHFWRSTEQHTASYSLEVEPNRNQFLRLGAGQPLYVEQFVDIETDTTYFVQVLLRSASSKARVTFTLCQKWLLTAKGCVDQVIALEGNGRWVALKVPLDTTAIGTEGRPSGRTVKFSMYNSSDAAEIDVDELTLFGSDGKNRLANGNFQQGFDHWYFSIDNDLPWHIWSLPIHLLFEQGWFGVVAFGLLLGGAMVRTLRATLSGSIAAGLYFAGLIGLSLIAVVDTLVDSPRILFLFVLLMILGWENTVSKSVVTPEKFPTT